MKFLYFKVDALMGLPPNGLQGRHFNVVLSAELLLRIGQR